MTEKKSEILDELDIEEFVASDDGACQKPHARAYRIRIDRERFRVEEECLTGAGILGLADKTPDQYKLFQRLRGGATEPIGPCDEVCFTAPGVERFMTIPCDTIEGRGDG